MEQETLPPYCFLSTSNFICYLVPSNFFIKLPKKTQLIFTRYSFVMSAGEWKKQKQHPPNDTETTRCIYKFVENNGISMPILNRNHRMNLFTGGTWYHRGSLSFCRACVIANTWEGQSGSRASTS